MLGTLVPGSSAHEAEQGQELGMRKGHYMNVRLQPQHLESCKRLAMNAVFPKEVKTLLPALISEFDLISDQDWNAN